MTECIIISTFLGSNYLFMQWLLTWLLFQQEEGLDVVGWPTWGYGETQTRALGSNIHTE